MPKIPTGTDLGLGEVRTDPARIPRQNFQTNADQFGAGNGRALVNVSKSLQKALADLREADQGKKQDEAAAQRAEEAEMTTAESNARDAVVTLNAVNILGEGNAKAVEELKARPRTATETAALAEQAKAGLLGIGRDAGAGLTIPRQQENFTEFYLRRLKTKTAAFGRHVAERTVDETAALMNSVTAREFETAVANFADARAVRSAKLTGAAAIELGMAGQNPDAIKAAKNDFGSAIDTAIAGRILDDDPEQGREFIARKRKLIRPPHSHRLDALQAAADANREAQTRSQQIWDRTGGDQAQALTEAGEIGGETGAAVTALLHQRANAARAAEKAQQDAAHDRARTVFDATGDIARIPVADRIAMSDKQRASLTAQAEHGPTGHPAKSDPATFFRLSRLPDSALAATDPRLHQAGLSAVDYQDLQARQKALQTEPGSMAHRLDRIIAREVDDDLRVRGTDFAASGDPADATHANTITDRVTDAVALFREANNRPPTAAELREIISEETDAIAEPPVDDEAGTGVGLTADLTALAGERGSLQSADETNVVLGPVTETAVTSFGVTPGVPEPGAESLATAAEDAERKGKLGRISGRLNDDPDAPRSSGGVVERRPGGPDQAIATGQIAWSVDRPVVAKIGDKYAVLDRLDGLHRKFIEAVQNGATPAEITRMRSELEVEINATKNAIAAAFFEDDGLRRDLLTQVDIITWKDPHAPGGLALAASSRNLFQDLRDKLDTGQPLTDRQARDIAVFAALERESGYLLRPTTDGRMAVVASGTGALIAIQQYDLARAVAEGGEEVAPVFSLVTRYASGEIGSEEEFKALAADLVQVKHAGRKSMTVGREQRDAAFIARDLIDAGVDLEIVYADIMARLDPALEEAGKALKLSADAVDIAAEGPVASFAREFMQNEVARIWYLNKIAGISDAARADFMSGSLTLQEAAKKANAGRNDAVLLARDFTSARGLAMAEGLKPSKNLPGTDFFTKKYASQLFDKNFFELSQSEQNEVWEEIIDKSGKDSVDMTEKAKSLGKFGRAMFLFSVAVSTYQVLVAEDKERALLKEISATGMGILGGAAGGAVALGLGFGPIGVVIGALAGSLAGALGIEFVAEDLDNLLNVPEDKVNPGLFIGS